MSLPVDNAIRESAIIALRTAEEQGSGRAVVSVVREGGDVVSWLVSVERVEAVSVTDGRGAVSMRRIA